MAVRYFFSRPSFALISSLLMLALSIELTGCGPRGQRTLTARDTTIVSTFLADVDMLNPVVATTFEASNVIEQIYPSLLRAEFDTTLGMLVFTVNETVAESYTIAEDMRSITYKIKPSAKWNDGTPFTSADVKFSYELYGDPRVNSMRQQFLSDFLRDKNGAIDLDQSILTPDPLTVTFHFAKPLSKNLLFFRTQLTPIPKHIWETVPRDAIRQSEYNKKPVTGSWYKLEDWKPNQDISLIPDPTCTTDKPGTIPRIVWRVIPDYTVRLTQLETGELDIVETIKTEDIPKLLTKNPTLKIKTVPPRAFDHLTYPSIDLDVYTKEKKIVPHPIFGSKKVRQALTLSIDRQSIIDGYLGPYGQVANTDISPIFKWAYNHDLVPYPYDPSKAAQLLDEEGWKIGPDGIRQKNGVKMKFKLYFNKGNARREYASNVIQQNWKQVGIICEIEVVESNQFFQNIMNRKYNEPVLAGNMVGLEIDPKDQWSSDLQKSRFNWSGFQNKRLDELMTLASNETDYKKTAEYWREFQHILHDEQPRTFLFWITQTHAFSSRISNENVSVLSTFNNLQHWQLKSLSGNAVTTSLLVQ